LISYQARKSVAPFSMPAEAAFEFVLEGPKGRGAFSNETKTKIRQQAMRAIGAARKQSGHYGKHNLRQLPEASQPLELALLEPKARVVEDRRRTHSPQVPLHLQVPARKSGKDQQQRNSPLALSVPQPMPLSGLDLLAARNGVDVEDLSALTTVHIAVVIDGDMSLSLAQNLGRLLACRYTYSYFSLLRPRYGHNAVLDHAVTCLIVKARSLLLPSLRMGPLPSSGAKAGETDILAAYGRALKTLQMAVNDEGQWDADLLCATNMLAIFEVGAVLLHFLFFSFFLFFF
jgi:hypothetical protein